MRVCRISLPLILVTLLAAASGCRSSPKVNWDERIGHYTYDQSVADMGPPNLQTTTDQGERVAEWVTGEVINSTVMSAGGPVGPWGYYGYTPGPVFMNSRPVQFCLRLTFGPQGELRAWKKLTK